VAAVSLWEPLQRRSILPSMESHDLQRTTAIFIELDNPE
jgi:hypothetical protein